MAADASKLAFSSAFRYERVALKDSVAFSITSAEFFKTITIPHNLGYIPYYRAYYTINDGKYYSLFANQDLMDTITIDSTNLSILLANFGPSTITGTIYYRIYEEQFV